VDPRHARLEVALAEDRSPARETVVSIANRRRAIAATNGGFFALADGAPRQSSEVRTLVGGSSRAARDAPAATRRIQSSALRTASVDAAAPAPAYQPRLIASGRWSAAPDIVSGGGGLLLLDGREITEWADENLSAGFDTTRHPRTMIGGDRNGDMWLVTVDGRQPWLSLGMTFTELKRLARRIGLVSALNLDGGGSTTMVVTGGWIVNHPSDDTGPRKVSDAIVVLPRR
jgi:exopolysaccharide biosynthesis protein